MKVSKLEDPVRIRIGLCNQLEHKKCKSYGKCALTQTVSFAVNWNTKKAKAMESLH